MPRSFATLEDDTYGVGILQFARNFAAKLHKKAFLDTFFSKKVSSFLTKFSPINPIYFTNNLLTIFAISSYSLLATVQVITASATKRERKSGLSNPDNSQDFLIGSAT